MEPRPKKSLLIGFLYFIQGLNNSLNSTIILTYPTIPSYTTLSIFELSLIPYSLKFIIAPIQERYSSITYGRRKIWIVSSILVMSMLCLLVSRFTDQKYVILIAFISIPQVLMGTLQDVALDALALKEIQEPDKISLFQMVGMTIGSISGSFLFMKLVSNDFGKKIGLSGKIMEVSTFFIMISVIMLITTLYFHFSYSEPVLESELEEDEQELSMIEIFERYKYYLDFTRRECRLAIYFFLAALGVNFFSKTYLIEVMKQGFSKERLNEISTLCLIPVIIASYSYGKVNSDRALEFLKRLLWFKYILCLFVFFYNSNSYWFLIGYILVSDFIVSFKMYLEGIMVNSFPLNKYSAMTVAMNNSTRNLGVNSLLQLWTVGHLGFRAACVMGFIIQALVFTCFSPMVEWIKDGEVDQGVNLEEIQQHVQ